MDSKEKDFLKRIQATFRIEAEEHLRTFSEGLIELEKTQPMERLAEIIETMFREIHSLKGAARSVDQKDAELVCQPLESVFSALKCKKITLSPLSFNLFYETVDWLSKLIVSTGNGQTAADRQISGKLINRLKELAAGNVNEYSVKAEHIKESETVASAKVPSTETDLPAKPGPISNDSVRISISKLDPLLLKAEEMVQTNIALNHRTIEMKEIHNDIIEWMNESHKLKDSRSRATPAFWDEWMAGNDLRLNKLESRMAAINNLTQRTQYTLNHMVDDHLDAIKQILMLPVSSLVEIFPGMVREIARDQNKEIDFIIRGTELEIDKRILEELKDPLIHLIRNSIDHGIGKPHERILQNKTARGNITLEFTAKENGQVEIALSDDGKGVDMERLLKESIKSGILSNETTGKIEPEDLLKLIYKSGVSTSSIITDISGRGLGLSIVHEKVLKLNGQISVETEPNRGTTFRILLPLSLATFRGISVKVKGFIFILPTLNVERVMNVEQEKIKNVENHETVMIDDHIISVVDLGEALGLPENNQVSSDKMHQKPAKSNQIHIVILFSAEHRIAFKVDDIIDEQQVLVKGLGNLLSRVKNISGATILGSGKVVPVLNINDLLKSAIQVTGRIKGNTDEEKQVIETGKILVIEDSITSRTMLKNILETAGYKVVTAIDGMDGFTKAGSGEFDLILSDVDMPGLNGFELTAKIRGDKKLNELPVMLLTALESREDRERGIEVGADAYIVKSSFEQGNLLEVIRKLI